MDKIIEKFGYSIKETAESLGVCERLVRELVREGTMRATRIGRRVIISRTKIERIANGGN